MHSTPRMRHDDEDDPKRRPQPLLDPAKHTNAAETAEVEPWALLRKDPEHDRHRHAC